MMRHGLLKLLHIVNEVTLVLLVQIFESLHQMDQFFFSQTLKRLGLDIRLPAKQDFIIPFTIIYKL